MKFLRVKSAGDKGSMAIEYALGSGIGIIAALAVTFLTVEILKKVCDATGGLTSNGVTKNGKPANLFIQGKQGACKIAELNGIASTRWSYLPAWTAYW